MSKVLIIGTIVAVVGLFALGGFLVWQQAGLGPSSPAPAMPPPPAPAPSPHETDEAGVPRDQAELDFAGWQTYRNAEFGFEVKLPTEFEVVFERKEESQSGRHFLLGEISILLQAKSKQREARTLTLAEAEMEPEFLKENYGQGYIFYTGENVNSRWTAFQPNTKNGEVMYTFLEATSFVAQEDNLETAGQLAAIVKRDGEGSFYLTFAGLDYLNFEASDCTNNRLANCPEPNDEDRKLFDQILSTFRFVDKFDEIKQQTLLRIANSSGFGYGIEVIGEIEEIDDINNDGENELFFTASGAGGTCVGGTSYKILYSPEDRDHFVASSSFLPSGGPIGGRDAFCPVIKTNQVWEGCGEGYVDYICYSNNLEEEKNAAFKQYLDNIINEEE